jgi:hypothetical protein
LTASEREGGELANIIQGVLKGKFLKLTQSCLQHLEAGDKEAEAMIECEPFENGYLHIGLLHKDKLVFISISDS